MKTFNPSTFFRLVTGVTSALLLCACASTSRVDLNSKGPERTYQVVNVMSAPDQAGDVSAALEAALQQHGFKTRVNPATQGAGTLTARFQDAWKRNGLTYLGKLNMELVDVDSKTVLVSSNWQNSSGHQAQSVPEVVNNLVAAMLNRLSNRRTELPPRLVRADRTL